MVKKKRRPPGNYAVGYGRPPTHTQFKPGQSGNRKGRPAGSKNIDTLLQEELNARVSVTEGGKRKTITKIQATLKQLVNKAASGDRHAAALLIALGRSIDQAAADTRPAEIPMEQADEETMASVLARIRGNGPQAEPPAAPEDSGATAPETSTEGPDDAP